MNQLDVKLQLIDLETEAIEIIKSLDTLRDGSGPMAYGLYQLALNKLRRPLLKQRAELEPYVKKLLALLADGVPLGEAAASLAQRGEEIDAAVLEIEIELVAVWKQLVVDLRRLGQERLNREEASQPEATP